MPVNIDHLNPCVKARAWLKTQPDKATAWATCERPDWMLWYAGRTGTDKTTLVRIACTIARRVLHLVPAGEDRPRLAIEAAEQWIAEPTAVHAADAADAAYAAAAHAAHAHAYAADAAYAAASAAAADAVYVAYAARVARATVHAAYAHAHAAERQAQCDIIRRHIPRTP